LDELSNATFDRVEIRNWSPVSIDDRFYACHFSDCRISSISSLISLRKHRDYEYAFEHCDFSGCHIHIHELIDKDLKKQKNYYITGSPPVLVGKSAAIDWTGVLLCVEKKPEHDFAI
jgi:hypothetical protein